jgi:hypothetical protein
MRALKVLGVVALAAVSFGCVPEWARDNETGIYMEIAGITGFAGGEGEGTEQDVLRSDVVTDGSVFNDDAVITVNVYRKNPTVESTSALEHVRLESYQVRYFRSDGHNVEGVDVPHRITGPLNSLRFHTPTGTDELEVDAVITLVRHQAKLEAPLINLRFTSPHLSGQGLITAVAEITVFARQITTGESLTATGRMQVTFADFADQ